MKVYIKNVKHIRQTKFESLKDLVDWQNFDQRNITGLDDRGDFETFKKNQYRKSEEWKWFCKQIIEKRNHKCERCGTEKDLVVHHHDPRNYSNLDENKFSVLCSSCHLKIESFCGTEERMKMCPNIDKKHLTEYAYKEKEHLVMNKTYDYLKRKWSTSVSEKRNPGKWINAEDISKRKLAEVKAASKWLEEHKNDF